MKLTSVQNACIAFGLELHSSRPEQLVNYYEDTLGLTFVHSPHPIRRYTAYLDNFALIIGMCDDPKLEQNTFTLTLLSHRIGDNGTPYFLPPIDSRLGHWIERYAPRVRDPDGNHVARTTYENAGITGDAVTLPRSWLEMSSLLCRFLRLRVRKAASRSRIHLDLLASIFAYTFNQVALAETKLHGYSHLVASREGIFAVTCHRYTLLVKGKFYGLTIATNGDVYCFEACGSGNQNRGRIIRLVVVNYYIVRVEIVIKGLDDGCHQIDFVGQTLLIVDCYNARILALVPGLSGFKAYHPLGCLSRSIARDFHHMNSLAAKSDGTIWLLLHNSLKSVSEVVVLGEAFEVIQRFPIPAACAHNIVFTHDSYQYLIADSYGGRIISAKGVVINLNSMLTRGVSLDADTCVVGESSFSTRALRSHSHGRVRFFNRHTWSIIATLELPAAPTEVRRIDGQDLSLSNYSTAQDV